MEKSDTHSMSRKRRLSDAYRFTGRVPNEHIVGIFGDQRARVVRLERTGKKLSVARAGKRGIAFTTARPGKFETYRVVTRGYTSNLRSDA